jgi:hypothetical protein
MTYKLAPAVEAEVVRVFAPESVSYVQTKLAETTLPWDDVDPKRFDGALNGACLDWRDTLMDAGLANEGWRQVLSARGIDCRDW